MKAKILIVDDHRMLAESLKGALDREEDMLVVGIAGSGREAIEMARKRKPHVIVMDICMANVDGMQAAHEILRRNPAMRILVLSAYSSPNMVEEMFSLGVAGYLLKEEPLDVVIKAIRDTSRGLRCVSGAIEERKNRTAVRASPKISMVAPAVLTDKQLAVLQLVAMGATNTEISRKLDIGYTTVMSHLVAITKKLGIRNRTDAVRYVAFHKILPT